MFGFATVASPLIKTGFVFQDILHSTSDLNLSRGIYTIAGVLKGQDLIEIHMQKMTKISAIIPLYHNVRMLEK